MNTFSFDIREPKHDGLHGLFPIQGTGGLGPAAYLLQEFPVQGNDFACVNNQLIFSHKNLIWRT